MSASLRPSMKATALAARLNQLSAGPSSVPLPAGIKEIRVRYKGLKGNGAAGHWAREHLPSLRYANPAVSIVVEPKPAPPVAAAPAEGEAAPETTDLANAHPWLQPPGVTIHFDTPSTPPAFFPLSSAHSSSILATHFIKTLQNPSSLEALKRGEVSAPSPPETFALDDAAAEKVLGGEEVKQV